MRSRRRGEKEGERGRKMRRRRCGYSARSLPDHSRDRRALHDKSRGSRRRDRVGRGDLIYGTRRKLLQREMKRRMGRRRRRWKKKKIR